MKRDSMHQTNIMGCFLVFKRKVDHFMQGYIPTQTKQACMIMTFPYKNSFYQNTFIVV